MDQKSHLQNYNISFHIAGTPYQQASTFSPTTSHQHQSQCQQVPTTQQIMQQPMQYVSAHQINQLQYQVTQGRHLPPVAQQQQQQQQQIVTPQQQPSYEEMFHSQASNKGHHLHIVPQENEQPAPSKEKEIDNLRAAHLEEVYKLQERIKELEKEKEEKEKLYERIQRRIRTDQHNVTSQQEAVMHESDDDVEGEQTFCPSPARSNSSVSSIKEEPVETLSQEGELTTRETSQKKSEVIEKEDAPEIELISHKKVSIFSRCIICQENKDEQLIMLTKDGIKSFHKIVVNRNDERSLILKDELLNHDKFLDNLPQYHPTCKRNFKITMKIETKPFETNFSLCIICQDNTGEKLLNITERGFPTIQFAVLHRDDAIAKRLKVSVESQNMFLSFKPKVHVTCRRYANRQKLIRKIEVAEKKIKLEGKVDNEPELRMSGEKMLQLFREHKQPKESSATVPLDISSVKFETHCFICKYRKDRKGKVNLKFITKEKYNNLRKKAEELDDENMLLIINSTDHPENKLQHHIKCLCSYFQKRVRKVHYNNLPYDIAFTILVKRLEEPLFIQGKAFDLIELRDEYRHYLSEQGVSSNLKSCKMMEKLKKYFTIPYNNCVVKISKHGLKYNILYSKHLTEDQIDAEVERLNRRRKRIADHGESDDDNEEGGADAADNPGMVKQLLGENVIASGNNANMKINRVFTKYKKEKIEKKPKELKFTCTECGFRCAHNGALLSHMKKHQNGDFQTSTLCDICGKSFKNRKSCTLHMLTHGEKKFSCTHCDKMFYTKDTLKCHEYIHTGEKKFKCTLCDMKFLRNFYLKKHMRTHSEERPFVCTSCGYTCKDKTRLNEHMVKHSDINPYVCDYCGKAFKYRSVFRHHKFTHTGKPHKCTVCGFSCYTKVNLKKHMETHGSENNSCKNQLSEYTLSKKKSLVKTAQNFKDIVTDSDSDSSNTTSSYPSTAQAQVDPLTSSNSSNACSTTTTSTAPWVYFPSGALPQYYIPNFEDIKFK